MKSIINTTITYTLFNGENMSKPTIAVLSGETGKSKKASFRKPNKNR